MKRKQHAARVLAAAGDTGNVVLDLDGCLYVSGRTVPGASEALHSLCAKGYRLIIATNNSTRHPQQVADHVEEILGVEFPASSIVTSGSAALRMLTSSDVPVLVVGEEGLRQTLAEAAVEMTRDPATAGSVLVGLDRAFDYDTLRVAMEAVLGGARFLATNGDATFPTDAMPVPGAGALVAAIERASGTAPTFAGKPHEAMRLAVEPLLGDAPTWIVGDRLDTDVAMGKAAGWATVLVTTGVTAPGDDIPEHLAPDLVLGSIAELPEVLP